MQSIIAVNSGVNSITSLKELSEKTAVQFLRQFRTGSSLVDESIKAALFIQKLEGPYADWAKALENDVKNDWLKLEKEFVKEFCGNADLNLFITKQRDSENSVSCYYRIVAMIRESEIKLTEVQSVALIRSKFTVNIQNKLEGYEF